MDGLRGVILAGGHGTRLMPLTRVTNKHLLPVGREPMIFHAVRKLAAAGVREILVVSGVEHLGHVVGALGSGAAFGCSLTYRVQDGALGIAQALSLAEDFVGSGRVVVLLGDNLFEDDLGPHLAAWSTTGAAAWLLLKEVDDPERFGVAVFERGQLVRIDEKPLAPASRFAVTGIYGYDAGVFEVIRGLRPSARGEYEITDVNNVYLERGDLGWAVLRGWWTDAGTHETLARANRLLGG